VVEQALNDNVELVGRVMYFQT